MLSQLAVIIGTIIDIYSFVIVVWCFMSFIPNLDRRHPAYTAVETIVAPVLNPMRRLLPAMGGIDISPILAIFLLRIVKELVFALLR